MIYVEKHEDKVLSFQGRRTTTTTLTGVVREGKVVERIVYG